MNAPKRDFRYLISVVDFNALDSEMIEKIIIAGMREPLTELLAYYKNLDFITKMSTTYSYIVSQIITRAAQKNSYPACLLPRFLDYPELICYFVEGFEKYLYNLRFSYSDNTNGTIYIDLTPGINLELSTKEKLYIFRHSDQEIVGLKRMYFRLVLSKQAEIILEQYRNLYLAIDRCKNKCSSNKAYCQ